MDYRFVLGMFLLVVVSWVFHAYEMAKIKGAVDRQMAETWESGFKYGAQASANSFALAHKNIKVKKEELRSGEIIYRLDERVHIGTSFALWSSHGKHTMPEKLDSLK